MLLTQTGKELGYKLSDEEFDRIVGSIRKENKLDTDEAFQAALKQEGMTLPDLRKSLEKNMLISRVTSWRANTQTSRNLQS
jgi:parvulin-like peptidyl-prolyl isomerase